MGDIGVRTFEGNEMAGWMALFLHFARSQSQDLLRFWGTERQPDGEVASPARSAVQFQSTAVGGGKAGGDTEAEAHALWEATVQLAAVKGGKDASLLIWADTRAGVTDPDPDFLYPGTGGKRNGASLRCILDGVAKQVAQDLCQPIRVQV